MEWMLMPLKRFADFKGRSRRKEFWMWVLGVIIVTVVLSILDSVLGLGGRTTIEPGAVDGGFSYGAQTSGGILTMIFALAILIPNLAVAVRRLHDTDRTGWWILLPLIPYVLGVVVMIVGAASASLAMAGFGGLLMLAGGICGIVLLVFYCLPGTNGPNKYGPDPVNGNQDLGETFR
ncbi:MAG: DUF805 domain-containing protein [Pseudomonadota bacterium]